MSMTPIKPNSVVYINWTNMGDNNEDPTETIEAQLVQSNDDGTDETWSPLASSTYTGNEAEVDLTRLSFIDVMQVYAQFHNLQVQNETGVGN